MAIKRVCDCCGKDIVEPFMLFKLAPYRSARDVLANSLVESVVPSIGPDELCNSCAAEVYERYRLMKANKQGKTLKWVCQNCGHEDDDNLVCPVCKTPNWSVEEE